jgi:hypothetical protein
LPFKHFLGKSAQKEGKIWESAQKEGKIWEKSAKRRESLLIVLLFAHFSPLFAMLFSKKHFWGLFSKKRFWGLFSKKRFWGLFPKKSKVQINLNPKSNPKSNPKPKPTLHAHHQFQRQRSPFHAHQNKKR